MFLVALARETPNAAGNTKRGSDKERVALNNVHKPIFTHQIPCKGHGTASDSPAIAGQAVGSQGNVVRIGLPGVWPSRSGILRIIPAGSAGSLIYFLNQFLAWSHSPTAGCAACQWCKLSPRTIHSERLGVLPVRHGSGLSGADEGGTQRGVRQLSPAGGHRRGRNRRVAAGAGLGGRSAALLRWVPTPVTAFSSQQCPAVRLVCIPSCSY